MPKPTKQIAKSGPRLATGNDAEVAAQLGLLVRDAQAATRRILVCGLFIETIVANLPQGQFSEWVEFHKETIGANRQQIYGWRAFTTEVLKQIGVQKGLLSEMSVPLHQALSMPKDAVPEDVIEVREKIDELIEGKSARQLMLQFREGEVINDELVRTGRGGERPGAGRKAELLKTDADLQREAAQRRTELLTRLYASHYQIVQEKWHNGLTNPELDEAEGYLEASLIEIRRWKRLSIEARKSEILATLAAR